MSGSLQTKIAIVTGAGRGIGQGIALGLAGAGAKVVCAARTQEQIDATVSAIKSGGGEAVAVVCDVLQPNDIENLIQKTDVAFGGLDILVMNAGGSVGQTATIEECRAEDWLGTVELNLYSSFHCARAAIPLLKKSDAGKIITLGSGLGRRFNKGGNSSYSVGKAALWMFIKCLATELIQYDIAVNELIPGPVITEAFTKGNSVEPHIVSEGKFEGEWVKEPKDVVPMALWLAEQKKYGPTGQSFAINRRVL